MTGFTVQEIRAQEPEALEGHDDFGGLVVAEVLRQQLSQIHARSGNAAIKAATQTPQTEQFRPAA